MGLRARWSETPARARARADTRRLLRGAQTLERTRCAAVCRTSTSVRARGWLDAPRRAWSYVSHGERHRSSRRVLAAEHALSNGTASNTARYVAAGRTSLQSSVPRRASIGAWAKRRAIGSCGVLVCLLHPSRRLLLALWTCALWLQRAQCSGGGWLTRATLAPCVWQLICSRRLRGPATCWWRRVAAATRNPSGSALRSHQSCQSAALVLMLALLPLYAVLLGTASPRVTFFLTRPGCGVSALNPCSKPACMPPSLCCWRFSGCSWRRRAAAAAQCHGAVSTTVVALEL